MLEETLRDLLKKYQAKKGLLPKGSEAQMRKLDIARRIHQEAGISEEETATLLEWILELLKTTLQKEEPIGIQEFGVFTVMPQLYCSLRRCGASR